MSDRNPTAERLQGRFSDQMAEVCCFRGDEAVTTKRDGLLDILTFLRDDPDLSYDYLVDVTAVDWLRKDRRDRFDVVYHLYSHRHNRRVRLKAPVNERDPSLPSATRIWRGAEWPEREVYDMFGIRFGEHPDLRRILMPVDFEGHPLRKDYPLEGRGERDRIGRTDPGFLDLETWEKRRNEGFREGADRLAPETMTLNLGPQHPAMHGTLRAVLELDGERIVKATPDMGYLHTGFEKLGEHRTYNQFVTITDRMNYLSPLANNIGYALAVEKLMELEVPKRAQYIRVILAELSRISDHMFWLGAHALDLGAFTVLLYALEQREKLYDIFESVTGVRLMGSCTRVGGLAEDVPEGFEEQVLAFIRQFPPAMDEMETLLTRNRIWIERTKGIGVISGEDAIAYSMTGPCLRGSGVEWDIRKAEPYSSYEDFDFEIPVGENGDVYDRYLVRVEETRQSCRIAEQAVKNLPDGPVRVDDPKVILPPKDAVYNTIEGLIHHFKLIMDGHGLRPSEGEAYASTEVPNGELGFYLVSDGTDHPYRVRVRPPSLMNYQAFPYLVEGRMVADLIAIIGSLNIIAGELDR